MKTFLYLILVLSFMIFSSCKRNEIIEEGLREEAPVLKNQLINWVFFNENALANYNFPQWFNEEIIDSLEIGEIELQFFSFDTKDDSTDKLDSLPFKKVNIVYEDRNSIEQILVSEFSSNIQLSESEIKYLKPTDSLGYSVPIITNQLVFSNQKNIMNSTFFQPYSRLIVEEINPQYIVFLDVDSDDNQRHYFILDSTNWNVSYIDLLFQPNGKDIYYYGRPKDYTSAFKLQDLVMKQDVEKRDFYKNGIIKSQLFYSNYFVTKRDYNYDQFGICTDFSDSLKTTDDEFIHLSHGFVEYENDLPIMIEFFNDEDIDVKKPFKRIEIRYSEK